MQHVSLSGVLLDAVFDRVDIDGVFVRQVVEHVVRGEGRLARLFVPEDEIDPVVQVATPDGVYPDLQSNFHVSPLAVLAP